MHVNSCKWGCDFGGKEIAPQTTMSRGTTRDQE